MSASALTWAWRQMPDIVSSPRRLVLVALADRADDDGELWPKTSWVAEKVGMSKSTVRGHIRALEENGYLERNERQRKDGSQTSNLIRLVLDDPRREPGAPPPEPRRQGAEQAGGRTETTNRDDHLNTGADEVWAHWVERRKPRTLKLPEGTRKQLVRALNAGYTVADLCAAVDGLLASDWHREHGKLQLSTIFATGPGTQSFEDRVQSFIDRSPRQQGGQGVPDRIMEWLRMLRDYGVWDDDDGWVAQHADAKRQGDRAYQWLHARGLAVRWEGPQHRIPTIVDVNAHG